MKMIIFERFITKSHMDKMRLLYEAPGIEIIEVNMEAAILNMSGEATRNGYDPVQTDDWV